MTSHSISSRNGTNEHFHLSDGRKFSWTEWGPRDGMPVLFCTGAGMDGSLGFGIDHPDELHIRLVAPDRPGLGNSSPHEQKSLSTWRDDIKELTLHLSLSSPRALGFSQGGPFALAISDIVCAVAIVSGQDDFSYAQTKAGLSAESASFVSMVQQKDALLLSKLLQTVDADGFFQMICSMSSARDRTIYEAEPFRSAYYQSLKAGFKNGASGYVADLINAMGTWPFHLEDIKTPVDLWYGALDGSPIHSPDFGATMAKRLPRSRRFVLADEGGSLLWTQAKRILVALLEH